MDKIAKIKGLVARDSNGRLHIHEKKPSKILGHWYGGTDVLDNLFQDIEWDNDPIEVELTINRVCQTRRKY